MSQKYVKKQNTNSKSTAYGKYYAKAVYDEGFVGIDEIADYIQQQASVKKSDVKAAIGELGEALKHYMEMGQKVRLDGIGIFKVGFSSIGATKPEDVGAQNITTRRVLFAPETVRVITGQARRANGTIYQKFAVAKQLVKDVVFEETHENSVEG
jgi:predicted histone-like DNA-binding protein